jgi:hypothetical protein
MNLKGKTALEAVGQCIQVLYDEGRSGLVPYLGVVVYVERHRCVLARRVRAAHSYLFHQQLPLPGCTLGHERSAISPY